MSRRRTDSEYQPRAEAFWQAEVSALSEAEAGLSDELPLSEIYAQYGDLFTAETVQELIAGFREQSDDTRRYLADFAAMRHLESIAAPFDEAFFNQLGPATIEWEGESVSFLATTKLLANESDQERRRRLYEARSRLVEQLNRTRRQRWQAIHERAQSLGFDNYYALFDELRDLRLSELQQMAASFLALTADPYFASLRQWGEKIVGTTAVDAADIFYLMRGARFDALFPPEKLVSSMHQTARGMGMDLAHCPGLELDLEPRPQKSPRPFCAYVRVPEKIKLVINPRGGHEDYRAVFHELGHALHGLHIDPDLPFARRYLGDDAVGESFAFLFENLTANPAWLHHIMGVAKTAEYTSYMRFIRLLFIRRCAAKLLYEVQLHRGTENPKALYAALLREHLGINIASAYYLLDVDDGFYNAQYFRAWMLESQLVIYLREQFGEKWFASVQAGDFLKRLWRKGQQPAEKLSTLAGAGRLNTQVLAHRVLMA